MERNRGIMIVGHGSDTCLARVLAEITINTPILVIDSLPKEYERPSLSELANEKSLVPRHADMFQAPPTRAERRKKNSKKQTNDRSGKIR